MSLNRLYDALAWRLRAWIGDERIDGWILWLARRWRPLLRRVTFVGVAGSAGKTTAKELLTAILAGHRRVMSNPGTFNMLQHLGQTLLRVRPWHELCVMEVSEDAPGAMRRLLGLLAPSISVVTVVRDDHLAAFASMDQLAGDMRLAVECLPDQGMAVLNADDPQVLAMAAHTRARILTYGMSAGADLRAEEVTGRWPDRLSLTLHYRGQRIRVATRLCGVHWVPSVLGATGAALAAGLTLDECVAGLQALPPFEGRMQPVELADGVTFIRDDFKAPHWGLDAFAAFAQEARASRKIVVLGEISDVRQSKEATYRSVVRRLLEIADQVIVVGPWASVALSVASGAPAQRLLVFGSVKECSDHVNAVARPGDLILLKGSVKQDHLQRIIHARQGPWHCWTDTCTRTSFCTRCPEQHRRHAPHPSATLQPPALAEGSALLVPGVQPHTLVVVGLGNEGEAFAGTPHNIGFEVLDHVARRHALHWHQEPGVHIARGDMAGRAVVLLKMRTAINDTGPLLRNVAAAARIDARQLVLVQDDLNLPLGTIKSRERGSAGGHKGVASVLQAFQTDEVRRVKVGVALPAGQATANADLVLAAFPEHAMATLQRCLDTAAERILSIADANLTSAQPPAPPAGVLTPRPVFRLADRRPSS